jgi:murein DD-endopeptidase MepM/ murein hydrolase activator NlpD
VPVWRITALAEDGAVVSEAALGKRTLTATLRALGFSSVDGRQLLASFDDKPSKLGSKAVMSVAKEKGTGRLLAVEMAASPGEVWQALRDGSGVWTGKKLDLLVEHPKVAKTVVVGADLRGAIVDAGFADQLVSLIDEALDGHADLAKLRPGSVLKIVATEERVEGAFARYADLHALEYQPAGKRKAIRVYHYRSGNKKPVVGYFNAKGEDPYRGKFRAPIPLARIASRFNPRRMHPVLHVVMPHNGIDFAASTGTPIYAPAAGTLTSVGDGGPCGNMIQIAHAGGLTSVYCHLSRFAPNSRSGAHVEERQLIGYVGQTGRVTGPHLHFGIKRGDRFIDPMTLKLDGVRVIPKGKRREFEELRVQFDRELDAIGEARSDTDGDAGVAGDEPDAGEVIYETP